MADRQISFSPAMVRALLEGRKTQTRRLLHFPGIEKVIEFVPVATDQQGRRVYEMKDASGQSVTRPAGKHFVEYHFWPKYAVGDRLYVREAWKTHAAYDDISPAAMGGDEPVLYIADGAHQTWGYPAITKIGRFRQGMHMPRWASRLTLIVTDVRVQRLQDISTEDAIAEGLMRIPHAPAAARDLGCDWGVESDTRYGSPVSTYAVLWDSLNAKRDDGAYVWARNPWVVAVSFTVHQRNIDQMERAG